MNFEIYKDNQNLWRWRLKAENHEIIAHGESYNNKLDCLKVITNIKNSSSAEINIIKN